MRPVTRPATPGAYPTTDLTTIDTLNDTLDLIIVPKPNKTVRDGLKIAAPTAVTMYDVLQGRLENVLNPPVKIKKKKGTKAVKAPLTPLQDADGDLKDIVQVQYKQAILPLKDALGRYCSYCGQIVTEDMPVEHVVAKSWNPKTAVSWDNFLLACGQCNSFKGERPYRENVVPWTGVASPKTLDLYSAVRAHYVWPDDGPRTSTNAYAYRSMQPQAAYLTTKGAWRAMKDSDAVHDSLTLRDEGSTLNKRVEIVAPWKGTPTTYTIAVNPAGGGAGAAEAIEQINALHLTELGDDKNGDNRCWDRTKTWVWAVIWTKKLQAHWDKQDFDLMCNAANTSGFLDAWVRVMELRGADTTAVPGATNLLAAFLARVTQTTAPQGAFPGTDLALIP